jgi:hypothetical protein
MRGVDVVVEVSPGRDVVVESEGIVGRADIIVGEIPLTRVEVLLGEWIFQRRKCCWREGERGRCCSGRDAVVEMSGDVTGRMVIGVGETVAERSGGIYWWGENRRCSER